MQGTQLAGHQLAPRSLNVLSLDNPARKLAIKLVQWKPFDYFIMVLIILNSVTLAMVDYGVVDDQGLPTMNGSVRNTLIVIVSALSTGVFCFESALKILALGLYQWPSAYLRNGWNVFDFIIVAASLISYLPGVPNVSALRTFRVLRPMRSLSAFPDLQRLVTGLLKAIPALLNVTLLLFFFFLIFGIYGVHLWKGILHPTCRSTPWPILQPPESFLPNMSDPFLRGDLYYTWVQNQPGGIENVRCLNAPNDIDSGSPSDSPWARPQPCYWPLYTTERGRVCTGTPLATKGVHKCPVGTVCGSNYDRFGHKRFKNLMYMNYGQYEANMNYSLTYFDNIVVAFITIFQCMTQAGWSTILHMVEDSYSSPFAAVFFCGIIIFGAFFLANLLKGVIWDNFAKLNLEHKEEQSKKHSAKMSAVSQKQNQDSRSDGPPLQSGGQGTEANKIKPAETKKIAPIEGYAVVKSKGNVLKSFMDHNVVQGVMLGVIFINSAALATDKYPPDATINPIVDWINAVSAIIFTLEMILRLLAYGKKCFTNAPAILDMVVVILGLVEVIMTPPWTENVDGTRNAGTFASLRTFRLLRVFKLAKSWNSLRILIETVIATLSEVGSFIVLLTLFIYIYALIGMNFFANKMQYDQNGFPVKLYMINGNLTSDVPVVEKAQSRFDDFFSALLTVFQVITGEKWDEVFHDTWRAAGPFSVLYFISLVIIGNYIVMNLFFSILLQNFQNMDELKYPPVINVPRGSLAVIALKFEQKLKRNFTAVPDKLKGSRSELPEPVSSQETSSSASEEADKEERQRAKKGPQGVSLGMLSAKNSFRRLVWRVVESPKFDVAVMALIFASVVCLVIESPLDPPNSSKVYYLAVINSVLSVLFIVEMVLKVLAYGILGHKTAYLQNGWNWLDLFVIVISLLTSFAAVQSTSTLKGMRALRAVRVARLIGRSQGMKQVITCLFTSLPSIINVLLFCFLFLFVFDIAAVSNLKGGFRKCDTSTNDVWGSDMASRLLKDPPLWNVLVDDERYFLKGVLSESCMQIYPTVDGDRIFAPGGSRQNPITSKFLCECSGNAWVKYIDQSFDNVLSGFRTLFELTTLSGWVDVMHAAMDHRGAEMLPATDTNVMWAPFFVVYIIVGAFFILNLFVGVVIDNYNDLKEKGLHALSSLQREWIKTQRLALRVSPARYLSRPDKGLRLKLFSFITKSKFHRFMIAVVLLNTITMSFEHFGQSEVLGYALQILNVLFSFIYVSESFAKILVMGHHYFLDPSNLFDFFTGAGSLALGILVLVNVPNLDMKAVAAVLSTLRTGRLIPLIKSAGNLRQLFVTLVLTLPSLRSIGMLLILLVFVYAIIGMHLFSFVGWGDMSTLNDKSNFMTIWKAMALVVQCSTGEKWNDVMYALAAKPGGCDQTPTYNEAVCGYSQFKSACSSTVSAEEALAINCCIPPNGCGSSLAYPYMISFTVIVTFIMINLFVAVILEGFMESGADVKVSLSPEDLDKFRTVWSIYDPYARGYVRPCYLISIISKLPPPLGFGGRKAHKREIFGYINTADVPIASHPKEGTVVFFYDVLCGIGKRILKLGANDPWTLENLPTNNAIVNSLQESIDAKRNGKVFYLRNGTASCTSEHDYAALIVQRAYRMHVFRRARHTVPQMNAPEEATPTDIIRRASQHVLNVTRKSLLPNGLGFGSSEGDSGREGNAGSRNKVHPAPQVEMSAPPDPAAQLISSTSSLPSETIKQKSEELSLHKVQSLDDNSAVSTVPPAEPALKKSEIEELRRMSHAKHDLVLVDADIQDPAARKQQQNEGNKSGAEVQARDDSGLSLSQERRVIQERSLDAIKSADNISAGAQEAARSGEPNQRLNTSPNRVDEENAEDEAEGDEGQQATDNEGQDGEEEVGAEENELQEVNSQELAEEEEAGREDEGEAIVPDAEGEEQTGEEEDQVKEIAEEEDGVEEAADDEAEEAQEEEGEEIQEAEDEEGEGDGIAEEEGEDGADATSS